MCSCIVSNVCWTSSRLLTEAGQGSPQTCKNRIQLEKKYLELNTHKLCVHTIIHVYICGFIPYMYMIYLVQYVLSAGMMSSVTWGMTGVGKVLV